MIIYLLARYKTMFEFKVSIDQYFIDTSEAAIRTAWTSLDSFLHTTGERNVPLTILSH